MSPRPDATSARHPLDRPAVVLVAYAVATVGLTWPLAAGVGSRLPHYEGDLWSELWTLWWWREALVTRGGSPYATDLLFHPDGVALASHGHSPLNALATLPLSVAWGAEAAYVVALLLGFLLSGFFTWLLVRDLWGEPRAAFVAGLLYAFSPMHLEQSLEHLGIASVQFAPLLAYFLLRTMRVGGWGNALGLGLAFAAGALVTWYWAVISLVLALALVVAEALTRRAELRRRVLPLLAAAGVATAIVGPFAWPMLQEMAAPDAAATRFHDLGVDPVFWGVPSEHHPVWGGAFAGLRERAASDVAADRLAYLGWPALVLAALAIAGRGPDRAQRRVWIALLGVFLLLALGSRLRLFGFETGVPLPHAAFEGVPLLGRLRVANRFQLWAFLPLAVLCGWTLARWFRAGRARLAWAIAALVVLDSLWLPYPTRAIAPHPFFAELRGEGLFALDAQGDAPSAVLPIPFPLDHRHSEALYDQIHHGRPIVGGYVSYLPQAARRPIAQSAFLAGLVTRPPRITPPREDELAALGIGVVLVHLDRTESARQRAFRTSSGDFYARQRRRLEAGFPDVAMASLRSELRRALGPPIYGDDRLEVYRVDARSRVAGR